MRWLMAGNHSLNSAMRVSTYHFAHLIASKGEFNPDFGFVDREGSYKILYLPAPISPSEYFKQKVDDRILERRIFWGMAPKQVKERMWQYTPLRLFPSLSKMRARNGQWHHLSLRWSFPPLISVLKKSGFYKPDVLIVTNLKYAWLDRVVKPRLLVYRAVDDIQGFSKSHHSLREAEIPLLGRCDLCVATSSVLADVLSKRGASEVHVIRNGAVKIQDSPVKNSPQASDLASIPHPRVLYIGAINERINFPWLDFAANKLPDFHFVLIGPQDVEPKGLEPRKNIHFLGPRFPENIDSYLHASDIGMIPFKKNQLVNSTCPIKLYEYLAAGIPVVATRWREIEEIGAPIELADDKESFVKGLNRSLSSAGGENRIAFAQENTWEKRFKEFERLVLNAYYSQVK
ncbi:glycosyltransferase [Acidobacteriota bacterium]